MELRDVILLGIDIHGLECADIINRAGKYRLLGFISQNPDYPESYGGYPVLGDKQVIDSYPHAGLIPLKWEKWDSSHHGDNYADRRVTLIDPSAFISSTAKIGKGCIIYPGCFIGANAILGDGVLMLHGCTVNHDNVIGDRTVLTSNVTIAGNVTVGQSVYMGQGSNVRQFVKIGSHSFVGMGAVVLKDVPENTTVIGNPARPYIKSGE
jgi:sugar O-acyltransferase (sialic acid O-acetyltransferase NeuD family)